MAGFAVHENHKPTNDLEQKIFFFKGGPGGNFPQIEAKEQKRNQAYKAYHAYSLARRAKPARHKSHHQPSLSGKDKTGEEQRLVGMREEQDWLKAGWICLAGWMRWIAGLAGIKAYNVACLARRAKPKERSAAKLPRQSRP